MSDTLETLYQGLEPDKEIGPDHHRFKLIKSLSPHLLGHLWQAEDLSVSGNPIVTLLFIKPELLGSAAFIEGIKKHASLGKQLDNKHLAQCFGFFTEKSKLLFLSYAKLDGLTLASMLEKSSNLTNKQRLGLIRQLAYALDIGFQKLRIAHGALTPDSIFINRKGGIKLTLFSLRETLLKTAALFEQPFAFNAYQAPEGFKTEKVSRAADVYSLAAIIYELYTGKMPFKASDNEHTRAEYTLKQPDELDDEQWLALQKALGAMPRDRFTTCTEMVKAVFPPEKDEVKANTHTDDDHDEADTSEEATEGEAKRSLKDKLTSIKFRKPVIPKYAYYVLGGIVIFVSGYALGWFISDFLNYKEKDLLTLQNQKQEEALQQMYTSLEAQQALNKKLKQDYRQAKIDHQILQSDFDTLNKTLENAGPEDPGNQIFKDQINGQLFGPDMVLLPAGEFRMGDQSGQGDDNEKPVHLVNIDKPFALSRFEVTFTEYDQFAEATGRPKPNDEGWGRGNQPVINVTWNDAKAYTEWLAIETGQPYRLPTESEWEYAARAGMNTTYWWGNKMRPNVAVCADCGTEWDGKQPAPVGSFPANTWGLHDMTGNVDEWVADCYEDNYQQATKDGSAYQYSGCADRVMRGGSWFEIDRLIRPASRYRHPQNAKRNSWGFRVALDIQ